MANETIGHCDCPICKKDADVRVTKKAKAYIHCDDCGFQGFARGYSADKLLREMTRKKEAPAVEVVSVATVAEAKTIEIETKPAPAPQPVAKVEVKPAAPAEEKTIFDYLGL